MCASSWSLAKVILRYTVKETSKPVQNVSHIGHETLDIVDGSSCSTDVAAPISTKLTLAGQRFVQRSEKRFDHWYWATE